MSDTPVVDSDILRDQVREKYRAVAVEPDATYHFHTGRPLAARLGYDPAIVDALPDRAVDPSPGSATRSRCGRSSPVNGRRRRVRRRVRQLRRRPSGGTTGP